MCEEPSENATGSASQCISETLAEMSHELLTPLTSMLIYARLLADNPSTRLSDEEVGFATAIQRAGSDLLHRINGILDTAWLEAFSARREADLSAELARLMLSGPDLEASLAATALHLRQALGLPWASLQLGEVAADERHEAFSLHDERTPATLLVPTGLPRATSRRLRARVLPWLEVLVRTAQERERSAQALKTARARIIEIADRTRHQIDRNLHDGAQQRLISIGLELVDIEAIAPLTLKPRLARTATALADAMTELRDISRGLRPPALTKHGIRPALAALACRCPITVDLDLSYRRLPAQIELAVYYIACEALANAARHAHASKVHVELTSGSTIRLVIGDDGVGGADPSRGSGLIGLVHRVEALDGTLEIVSPAGGGTELLAEFPACCD
ncbi:histidine kinase dimerization/phospho-acceptor domain-containing protein [Actinoallomurus bryophytorum]|uniref:histidine kinase dimerization/phospho-acceptor domain-containing protein n=1 Tax=Actinoallomurus bryophytorum TaxID=1490222 RepID=UPI0016396A14|nr:histidine kinase dimerization/phospho-acceptor domain-containing protein [Actinoallomurus bryophytorum]